MHYYSDNDVFCAAMLQNLVDAKLLPYGHVDCRSILDVTPADLRGYTSCHFFAGIGGWPLALRIAGWPEERPVWTASCPCQPWSRGRLNHGVTCLPVTCSPYAPFQPGDRWPQPLLRSSDARVSKRVAIVRALGNAIDPYVGADFVWTTSQGLKNFDNLL